VPSVVASSTLRRLQRAGLLTWLLVGLSVVLSLRQPITLVRFGPWLVAFLVFGAAYGRSFNTLARATFESLAPWIAVQVACVLALVLLLCQGFEGTLLVLVALQLGLVADTRTGVVWVVAQSALLAWAIQLHWSLPPAVMLTPPYFGFQLVALFAMRALDGEARARLSLTHALAELRATQELLAEGARSSERLRLSREIHDAIGHHLVVLGLNLEEAARKAGEEAREPLATARALGRLLLTEVGEIVTSTRQARRIDLGLALTALAETIKRPAIRLEIRGDLALDDPERAHAALRCCQEMVTNAVKHSGAENLWLELALIDGTVEILARDDGHGPVTSAEGFGLQGMRERIQALGGRLEIGARAGRGVEVRAVLPARETAR
jgi:signal transduction histidine kinase